MHINFTATAAFGLESMVALELKALGYENVRVQDGKVSFTAEMEAIPRCNLWLRCADRLLIEVGEFTAATFDELFEKTRSLPWEKWLPENAQFPVTAKSLKSKLFSVSDCQAIAKKAIVESMKRKYHRSWFPEDGSRYRIQLALLSDRATISIDTSGPGLHKRGYRTLSAPAPLKETLAAAMVLLSRWKADRAFIDPFCGSGTLPIEAGMIGLNMAPGLNRDFAAQTWPNINKMLWQRAREQARDAIVRNKKLGITGIDIDKSALQLARYHSRQAGLEGRLSFHEGDVSQLRSKYQYGYLICNPPYGERLSEKSEVEHLYAQMAAAFARLDTWSFYVLTSHPGLEKIMNRKASKRRKLYNGRIQCTYYQFFGPKPSNLQGPF